MGYEASMKKILVILMFLVPLAAAADSPTALGPNQGKFGNWTAATYGHGSGKICYAFTDAQTSNPSIAGRGAVMLTVTKRPGAQHEVTLSAGYTYPPHAKVVLNIGNLSIPFYTKGQTAFTTEGESAISAFKIGAVAQAQSTGPQGHSVNDDFSLTGFSDSYAAITAACP